MNKNLRMIIGSMWLIAFLILPCAGHAADVSKDFQGAEFLNKQGKFNEAAKVYDGLAATATAKAQPVIFFNAGNSYFRAGDIVQAIWNYERALARNPWYADARYNLNAAKSRIEYKIEDHRNFFIRFHDMVLIWVQAWQLACAALIFLMFFLVGCAAWLWNSNRQSFWAFPRGEFLTIFLLIAMVWCAKVFYTEHYQEAIVIASEAEVRYGPSTDNQSLMKLGGGLKVYIVDSREDWSRVLTWNGETGWIKNNELGRIES